MTGEGIGGSVCVRFRRLRARVGAVLRRSRGLRTPRNRPRFFLTLACNGRSGCCRSVIMSLLLQSENVTPSNWEAGMQTSERQWRILSLLERLGRWRGDGRGSVSKPRAVTRQVQRMRKRFAGSGAAGLVHGNAGRSPKHRTSQEVREQVVMLRRGRYDGLKANISRRSCWRSRGLS